MHGRAVRGCAVTGAISHAPGTHFVRTETRGRQAADHTGRRFGRLTAIRRVGTYRRCALWECRCDCGTVVKVASSALSKTPDRDCGCSAKTWTDGVDNPLSYIEHACWSAMWTRCTWPGHKNWSLYGGRGIAVCDRWRSFALFLSDMGPRPSKRHSLDRIDSNGNYELGNCRWATQIEQGQNTRRNIRVVVDGVSLRVSEAASLLGITACAVRHRVARGTLRRDEERQ